MNPPVGAARGEIPFGGFVTAPADGCLISGVFSLSLQCATSPLLMGFNGGGFAVAELATKASWMAVILLLVDILPDDAFFACSSFKVSSIFSSSAWNKLGLGENHFFCFICEDPGGFWRNLQ